MDATAELIGVAARVGDSLTCGVGASPIGRIVTSSAPITKLTTRSRGCPVRETIVSIAHSGSARSLMAVYSNVFPSVECSGAVRPCLRDLCAASDIIVLDALLVEPSVVSSMSPVSIIISS